MTAVEHVALTVQRDIQEIADLWPELTARLTGGSGGDQSGVRRPPGSKPPIDVHIADVTSEIQAWAVFLARVLIDETDWAPGNHHDTPAILHAIATQRVGHFTSHQDTELAHAVTEDAARLAKLARNTARPTGRRTIQLNIPCLEHDTTDLGERTICTGQYATTLTPGERIGDFVCTKDPQHRMTPLEWQRSQRHDPKQARDMDALVFGGQVRHVSERMSA